MLPDSPRGRLRWALSESLVVAGIVFAWIGVVIAAVLALRLLTLPFRLLGLQPPTLDVFLSVTILGNVVLVGALVTSLLYVGVRVGTLLIDYWRRTA